MHHRFIRGVAAAALLLVAGAASAQDFSTQRLSDEIRTISADDFQGRYPGTDGEKKTLDWLQAQYEAMGLEPGGRNGEWLQVIDLKRLTPQGAPTVVWTGPDGARHDLTPGTDVTLRAMNVRAKGSVADAAVVFAGYGVYAPERGWDDYGDLDVRGKVVLVVAGEPDGDLFNGPYSTTYQSGAYKADEAKRRGALAVLTVVDADRAWQRETAGASRIRTLTPGAADLELTGAVNGATAQALGLDMGALKPRLGTGDFRAFELPGVRLSAAAEEKVEILRTHNLLARITGTERPNEVIVYSAHWDHVGVNEHAAGDDKIFNGAWDNASGTVGVVEMARQLKAAPAPKRTIVSPIWRPRKWACWAHTPMWLIRSIRWRRRWPTSTSTCCPSAGRPATCRSSARGRTVSRTTCMPWRRRKAATSPTTVSRNRISTTAPTTSPLPALACLP